MGLLMSLKASFGRQCVTTCIRIKNIGACSGEIKMVYIANKSSTAFFDYGCETSNVFQILSCIILF